MSIFKKLFKRPVETDKAIQIDSHIEPQEMVIRKIIDGKLYDTSKATKIGSVVIPESELTRRGVFFSSVCGQEVIIYKGNTEYFICYYRYIQPVSEEWVKKWLGQQNIEKYIELFGEPGLA